MRAIEAGQSDPRVGTLYRLARALGCSLSELMPTQIDEPPDSLDDIATAMAADELRRLED